MQNPKDTLAREIRIFLENKGIDPIYAVTLLGFLILLSYRKDIQNWKKLESWKRGLILSTGFGVTVLTIISLLRLTGVIDL